MRVALALCLMLGGCGLAPDAAAALGGAVLGYLASVNNVIAGKETPPPAPPPLPPVGDTWTVP